MADVSDKYPANVQTLLPAAIFLLGDLWPGWTPARVLDRIGKISRYVVFNNRMDKAYRRSQAAEARKKLDNPLLLASSSPLQLSNLRWIADQFPVVIGKGGDRRSDLHSVRDSVLRMTIRLYIDATGKRGFARGGRMSLFCRCLGLLLVGKDGAFTDDMVRGSLRRLLKELPPKRPRPRLHYSSDKMP